MLSSGDKSREGCEVRTATPLPRTGQLILTNNKHKIIADMLQQEFEERTGLKLKADDYREVEEIYMNTDLDKDLFCKLWIENPTALKEIERKTVLVRKLYEERKSIENFLIDQSEKWIASELREKVISMIGEREYLRRKIEKGYNIWEDDKELLLDILKD